MRIVSIGGGPAGLYFSLLMKKADPGHDITVVERNRADDTFGFGVVFSDATLESFAEADRESYTEITGSFAHWDDIDIHYRGEVLTSTGHGFAGIARQRLLDILQRRCAELGVRLEFQTEVGDLAAYADADLVVGADGVNSVVRGRHAEQFQPQIDWRPNKFVWLGTTFPFAAFTFLFKESEHGLWRVHAYRYDASTSTFILETTEQTWRRAGLDQADEDGRSPSSSVSSPTSSGATGCSRIARSGAASRRSATSPGTIATSCWSATRRTRRISRSARARSSRSRTRSRSPARSSATARSRRRWPPTRRTAVPRSSACSARRR